MSEKIYKVIPESKNIIVTLVNSINNDETFQKHLNKLSESNKIQEQKKAIMINTTIQKIKVFNTKINPLFLAKDIGILMGISQINYLIRKFDPEEKVTGYITKNNKTKKVIFLTRHGIYRCFFASRSPLARVFRKFICNLIDHMIENETEIIEKLSVKFQLENEQLINDGMFDLRNQLVKMETKYLEEQKKAVLLELQCIEEQKKRHEMEEKNTEIDIINSYNMMHIEQLKKDKNACISKIKHIHENIAIDESDSVDLLELKLLKEKYMKPMYTYILHPKYFKKLLKSKQREISQPINNFSDDLDKISITGKSPILGNTFDESINDNNTIDCALKLFNELISDTVYEDNFTNIFTKDEIYIDPDEVLYFSFNFGRNVEKKVKLILVNTYWVANRKHFVNIINSLCNNCETLYLTNTQLYKTSLDEIRDIVREEFISLSNT